jgi:hypothetical protein
MAALTNAAHVKKALDNSEPSTHGTPMPQSGRRPQHQQRKTSRCVLMSAYLPIAAIR